jgi:hypothetical protein
MQWKKGLAAIIMEPLRGVKTPVASTSVINSNFCIYHFHLIFLKIGLLFVFSSTHLIAWAIL